MSVFTLAFDKVLHAVFYHFYFSKGPRPLEVFEPVIMASNDVRDILDVKVTEARPAKKQKLVVRRPGTLLMETLRA